MHHASKAPGTMPPTASGGIARLGGGSRHRGGHRPRTPRAKGRPHARSPGGSRRPHRCPEPDHPVESRGKRRRRRVARLPSRRGLRSQGNRPVLLRPRLLRDAWASPHPDRTLQRGDQRGHQGSVPEGERSVCPRELCRRAAAFRSPSDGVLGDGPGEGMQAPDGHASQADPCQVLPSALRIVRRAGCVLRLQSRVRRRARRDYVRTGCLVRFRSSAQITISTNF